MNNKFTLVAVILTLAMGFYLGFKFKSNSLSCSSLTGIRSTQVVETSLLKANHFAIIVTNNTFKLYINGECHFIITTTKYNNYSVSLDYPKSLDDLYTFNEELSVYGTGTSSRELLNK